MTCRYPVIGSLCAFAVESSRTRWISTGPAHRASFIKRSENARPEAETLGLANVRYMLKCLAKPYQIP